MSITTFWLQPDVEKSLNAMAGKLQRSKCWIINQALSDFIERQVLEQSRWQETLKAMESMAQGKVVSAEAVHTWLQSWGSPNELQPPKAGQ